MKKLNIVFFVLSMILLSCAENPVVDCFTSTGPITKTEREIGQFTNIALNDNINLFLRKSNANKLVLEAGSNLMEQIETSIDENGTLTLSNNNSCNWVRSYNKPINVYLDFAVLDSIEYRSIGNISTLDTIRMDSLHLDVREGAGEIRMAVRLEKLFCNLHYGTTTIIMTGYSGLCFTYSASFGLINNMGLETKFNYVTNKSSNDVYVRAGVELNAKINNIGNIYYAGPDTTLISLEQTSSGQLIRIEK